MKTDELRGHLLEGHVIPAHPLALDASRRLDERCQRALTRYYLASRAGGIAVGVHTTQFAIREHGLYAPVLELAAETMDAAPEREMWPLVRIAGLCGDTRQAMAEAEVARTYGYDAGLLSLAAWQNATDDEVLQHCRTVAEAVPLFGFYLQPAVGGRVFSHRFWRRFVEIENVVAIKIAPFNRYQTIDVVRAVAEARRDDIALYTGNDDNIVADLLTSWSLALENGALCQVRMAGGLLGQWACWTREACRLLDEIQVFRDGGLPMDGSWWTYAARLTDANAAIFDAANNFAGCIPGIHEVLRRQGLMRGTWCLDEDEVLSPGQMEEIDRVYAAYPGTNDDEFVAEHLDSWLR